MKKLTMKRRDFLKLSALVTGAAVTGLGISGMAVAAPEPPESFPKLSRNQEPEAKVNTATGEVTINPNIIMRNSACLGCYSSCGNRVKINKATGQILHVTGNPYNPTATEPHLPMKAPLTDAYLSFSNYNNLGHTLRGAICGRGNATLTAHYDPNRILIPLKRNGERGSGKWKPISWEEAVSETVEGGQLFKELGDDREIEGFRQIYDPVTPMDPEQPELGPKSEQLVFFGGRGDGRAATTTRFLASFGTDNLYSHAYSCGGAVIPAGSVISKGQYMRPDVTRNEFIIFNGAYPGHSGKPMSAMARQVAVHATDGNLKFVVVDPAMLGGTVSPTEEVSQWVPIKPVTDAAFVMGMLHHILDKKLYNEAYLSSPNFKAAVKKGFNSYCNASHLIVVTPDHELTDRILRAEDLGIATPPQEDPENKVDYFVAIDKATGQPQLADKILDADLLFAGTVTDKKGNSLQVKTAFVLLKESVFAHDKAYYADTCGIPEEKLVELAEEFTSHGPKVAITGLGGTAAINGSDTVMAHCVLACMTGCYNMPGGMVRRRIAYKGATDGARYKLGSVPGKPQLKAMRISRTGIPYEKTAEYRLKKAKGENPYPSKLPWYPVGTASDNQAVFSIVNSYPYAPKIVMNWMFNPLMSTPGAGQKVVYEEFKKTEKIPLLITIDAFMGEMAAISDYIIPDTTPYESWGLPNNEGNCVDKVTTLRWPVVKPATMQIGEKRYACFENYLIDVAKSLKMPGFGENAIEDVNGNKYPLHTPEDLFLRGIVNVAYDGTPVPDLSSAEMELMALEEARKEWNVSLSEEEWKKAAFVISRGGRFAGYGSNIVDGKYLAPHKDCFNFYVEKMALAKNSYNGKRFSGTLNYHPEVCLDGKPLRDLYPKEEWPFAGVSYKAKYRSVTMLSNSILKDLSQTNYIEINTRDAGRFGFKNGDKVKLVAATGGETTGELLVREGVAEGSVVVAFGYGHWAYGAADYTIGSDKVSGQENIKKGVFLSGISLLEPTLLSQNTYFGLSEMLTGMCARNGGAYRIEKI